MRQRTVAELRDDAKALLPHVNLEQVYAIHISFRAHDGSQTGPFTCDTDLRVRGERTNHRIETRSRYETTARSDRQGTPTDVWTALVEGVAVFRIDDPDLQVSEDQLESFALLVGMPILHPYAREWTQTVTSQSQYPAFTLGLLDSPAELPPGHVIELPERDKTD